MFSPEEIGSRMRTQDNLATAPPYIIALQEEVEVFAQEGNGDKKKYWDGEACHSWNSLEEFRARFKDDYTPEEVAKFEKDLVEYEVKFEWVDRNWFFTQEGYDEHLRLNGHNYGRGPSVTGKVRPYIRHLFRNPEMKAVWDLLVGKPNG
jgi:hypothetical protein